MSPAEDRPTVLIIDDEEVVLDVLQNLLEDEHLNVLTALNGRRGRYMMERYEPSVVMVDKNLPDGSGLDWISEQKKRYPQAEFIMITAYSSLDSAVQAMKAGAYSYLTKPFEDLDVVLNRVRSALTISRSRNANRKDRDPDGIK